MTSEQSDLVFEDGAIRLGSVKKSSNAGGPNGHGGAHEDDWSEADADADEGDGEARDGDYHEEEGDVGRQGLMGNANARRSFVEVGGPEDEHLHPPRNGTALEGEASEPETSSALSTKAGIILVRSSFFLFLLSQIV